MSTGTRQQWIIEDASEFPGLSSTDKPNAVRLRNVSNGYYMTCDNSGPSAGSYYLYQKEVRPTWDRQVWIKENVGGSLFRFRCLWQGPQNSSTLDLTNHYSSNTGTQQVYVEDRNVYNPNQRWTIADAGSKYIRSDLLQDGDSKHTYATAMSSSSDAGINGQYLNTGAQSQEWVFEDASDFTSDPNAVRIRNAWTNYYLTCNHLNKSGDQYHPYYWILNQNLNKGWNTD